MMAIIDYGVGNLVSAEKAFVALGAPFRVSSDYKKKKEKTKKMMTDVGAFGD